MEDLRRQQQKAKAQHGKKLRYIPYPPAHILISAFPQMLKIKRDPTVIQRQINNMSYRAEGIGQAVNTRLRCAHHLLDHDPVALIQDQAGNAVENARNRNGKAKFPILFGKAGLSLSEDPNAKTHRQRTFRNGYTQHPGIIVYIFRNKQKQLYIVKMILMLKNMHT